jgi:hypothetical protein
MLARAGSLFKPDDPLELEMKTPSVPQAEGAGGAAGGAAAAGRAADNVEQPPPSVGEYSLRILLVSARDILAIDDEDTPSPFAKVSLTGLPCDDQTWEDQRKTKPKSTANCFFDSTIVFEFDLSDGKQLSMGTLTVEIWDRKLLSFDELLGSYVLDLSKLWDMREHELWRKWVGLVDVTGAAQGAGGTRRFPPLPRPRSPGGGGRRRRPGRTDGATDARHDTVRLGGGAVPCRRYPGDGPLLRLRRLRAGTQRLPRPLSLPPPYLCVILEVEVPTMGGAP